MYSHLPLYFSLILTPPPPLYVLLNLPRPFLTTWWSVYCQAIWSVMLFTPPLSQKKKKKKNLWQDMMTYPGGVFHWSLGLMGEDSQPRWVCLCMCMCVCVYGYSIWWCVYPGPCAAVLWCWVSPWSGLSPAARETSCEADRFVFCTHLLHSFLAFTHTKTHTDVHIMKHIHKHKKTLTLSWPEV